MARAYKKRKQAEWRAGKTARMEEAKKKRAAEREANGLAERAREKARTVAREWHRKNRELVNARRNTDEQRAKRRKWMKERGNALYKIYDQRPENKITRNLRARIRHFLKSGTSNSHRTAKLIGCSPVQLISHLESQWDKTMNWSNYGTYWHVDHRLPCASFDLNDPGQQLVCFHFSNLQPMHWRENIVKGKKITDGQFRLMLPV